MSRDAPGVDPVEQSDDEVTRTEALLQGGAEIAGPVIGGAIGLIGGPPGVLIGAAAGAGVTIALKHVGAEIHDRWLAPRQRVRVGGALAYAADEIRTRLVGGEIPRSDLFGENAPQGRDAEELLEGLLIHAANSYEERKLPYLGWLYASLAFRPDIAPPYAHFLLRLADRLTYRQLVSLALFESADIDLALMKLDIATTEGDASSNESIIAELNDLDGNVLGIKEPSGSVVQTSATLGGGSFLGLPYAKVGATRVGQELMQLMRLDRIPASDIEGVFQELGGTAEMLAKPSES